MIDFATQDKALAVIAKSTEREIERVYATSLRNIRNELKVYADKVNLTYAEMAKYNRLQNLNKEITSELVKLNRAWEGVLNKGISAQYFDSYFRTAFLLEKTAQAKLSYSMLPLDAIKIAIDDPFKNLAIVRNKELLVQQMQRTITQGLVQGTSYTKLSKDIKSVLETNIQNALRVTRTETHRIVQKGRLDSAEHAEALGVELTKIWQATLDDRTRDTHGAMDGQEKRLDEDFVSPSGATGQAPGQFGAPEEDINCRCTITTQLKGFTQDFRRVRGEGIVPQTTYKDWAKDKEISNPYLD